MTPTIPNILGERRVEGSLAEERPIAIPHRDVHLTGSVAMVPRPNGVVLVANDRGCSRHSPLTRRLTAELRRHGFTTVLVDLLLPAEVGNPAVAAWMRTQIDELARRSGSARIWIAERPELPALPVVLFGEGAGAAATLLSAAVRPAGVAAVIAHGERPDTVGITLQCVRAPALLLVDARSDHLSANLRAHGRLSGAKGIELMPDGSTPEDCARSAAGWLGAQLSGATRRTTKPVVAGTVPAV